ncbi:MULTISPECIES: MarR family winged helix-turn-helix transcriptional regulator [Acinetobacter]|jgi:DNA-binding MarR family transcriptional regulator|uniref:Organic hydroperoxide resistance transcriptional regulator n=9 Tax=Acinetobacter TaxID=469 RepID=D0SGN4_ACIJO|nr:MULTISPECIES: MarR family transcriptional regulator [Acinetobacter]ECE6725991.1 MarR family transcriptional regulator [Salmonella enterica subsp. enterica serovar Paratyphi A]EEY94871.1 organic hydroperoxide resistance transcriptional regulator [Acinetobacter johnsonii SH046]KAB0649672.1 MarR family transcriptional regulator [Acinetobacter bohemicus]MBL8286231.1 MarR family transcriptional regulator [Acinetobacter johnsonii]MBP5993210.1 MarR family transcriptional regulator [Acinetobacter s
MSKNQLCLDEQLCFPIYAASNLIVKAYRPFLTPLGLTYPQYLVMLVLWEKDCVSVGDLGQILHLDSGTLTPLLKRMETSGLINRSRDPNDERRVLISLKDKGRDLSAEAEKIPKELTKNIEFANLNQLRDELKALVNLLSERI